ncbi:MAG: sugar ABC transporter permease, partial [Clostridia bacterium]|nr:sugar ABC transporter permease [Clostridia bacterium]
MTNTQNVTDSKPKKRKIASLDRRKARAGWFFVLPFIIGFLVIYLPIVFRSLQLSFSTMTRIQGNTTLVSVGFENYREALFVDPNYVQTLISGLTDLAFDVPAIVIFSLFMAVLLNQKMVGRGAFRALLFLPVIVSTGIASSVNMAMSDAAEGGISDGSGANATQEIVSAMDIQALFSNMVVGQELVEYVAAMINDIYDIVNRSGVQMLIFLAGLQSISPAIYESCAIDGATAWETFWKITLPMISPMILVNTIYTVIDAFTGDNNTMMSFIMTTMANANGSTLGAAMAWMYFLVV